MMHKPPHDPGVVRWYVYIPRIGKLSVPPGVVDREGYALARGATRLFRGNEVVWVRPESTSGPVRHLAVVR
jgi:hypothetical protein